MTLYLYDPRTNISTKTSYKKLQGITGRAKDSLMTACSKGNKIRSIGCYITRGIAPLKQRKQWYAAEKYDDEAWLYVTGTNKQFKVSNYGRVKRVYKTKENFLMPYQLKGKGNLFVKMIDKNIKVSHLVADHFIRERKPNERVARKNGIITDDYVGNLEILTLQELGRRTGYKVSTAKEVLQICAKTNEIVNEYRSSREASRNYFMSYQAILDRCNGKVKQTDGYIWMFADDYKGVGA